MTNDLVRRLRERRTYFDDKIGRIVNPDGSEAADRIAELEEKIENANQAASETQPDWRHRCYRILSALGFDYGDPDFMMPDEVKKLKTAEDERDALRLRAETAERERDALRAELRTAREIIEGQEEVIAAFHECVQDATAAGAGYLREAAAKTLSVRSALTIMRAFWRASARRGMAFATENPQTVEQWRAFGNAETGMAYADELDPDQHAIFEPSELAKAQADVERLTRQNAALVDALRPSGETKAAYIGEFSFHIPLNDDEGNEVLHKVTVPWDVTKQIMKAISARISFAQLDILQRSAKP